MVFSKVSTGLRDTSKPRKDAIRKGVDAHQGVIKAIGLEGLQRRLRVPNSADIGYGLEMNRGSWGG
jgi:hypothetical protein